MTIRPTLVLYHGNCPDGFAAAAAAWTYLGDGARYRAVNYGEPPVSLCDVDGHDVYLLDFTYPRDVLEKIRERALSLTIIDHHKTAQEDLAGFPGAHFDMKCSGAVLTWKHFFGDSVPLLLLYVQDRDLWQWALEDSHAVSLALWAQERSLSLWSAMILDHSSSSRLATEGKSMQKYQRMLVEQMCAQAVWVTLGGHRVPVTNASVAFSEVADELLRRHAGSVKFAGYFFDRADGKRQWGLRSRADFDVSAVARLYGGGGHAQAAGFTTDSPPKVHSGPCARRVRIVGDQSDWTSVHVESEDGKAIQCVQAATFLATAKVTNVVLTHVDGSEEVTELAPARADQ